MITPLSEALAERGFAKLTPVQEAVIAPGLEGSDLLVSAQTGSGKTVGFGLAIAPTLLGEASVFGPAAAPLGLVVAPTRELAFQVKRELEWLYAGTKAVVASCVGGMDIRQERRGLERGAHIVVGTPGRLRDHIERRSLDLGGLRAVILDEADEMLDLGFREDLEFILGAAPAERRTLLFSATVPPTIAKLAQQFQRDARRIDTLSGTEQHADIAYQVFRVSAADSEHAIFNLLRYHHDKSAIVFANTRAAVNHLTARLTNRGLATVSLSGELSQNERTHALQAMRDGRARVCVATDVAARGIDLPNLNLVIHADLPTNTESLLHRSGRTGRAGRKGISALIAPPKAVKKAERLLKWAKISAEWTLAPSADEILQQDEERLLSDPSWNDPVTEEEAAFAARLLARYSPEAIAAAYRRLHLMHNAAPEELLPPDSKPDRKPREFGPSRWVALSVGRGARAEARWLLPLLCRAGNLDKSDIGAIRVQETETFVELTEASIDRFFAGLGADRTLEDGITARPMDGPPDLPSRGRAPGPEAPQRRAQGPSGPAKKPHSPKEPRKEPARSAKAETDGEPVTRHKPAAPPAAGKKPRHASSPPSGRPRAETMPSTATKPGAKPEGGKPSAGHAGKPGSKPAGKFGKTPQGKPKGKGAAPASAASDPSRRFSPPGKGKAPGKPSGKSSGKPRTPDRSGRGGQEPPRRKPR